jgi:hypothetical protein
MFARAPLSLYSILTTVGLLVMGSETVIGMSVNGTLVPAGFVVASIPVLSGIVVLSGIRWLPALGASVAVLGMWIGFQNPIFIARLTHPEIGALSWLAYVQLSGATLALVAGIAATRHNYRRSPAPTLA